MSLLAIGKTKDTKTLELTHPATGEVLKNADDSPMTITIYGPYSSAYYKRIAELNRDALNDKAASGDTKLTDEEVEERMFRDAAAKIADWNITIANDPEPFSVEKAIEVFRDFRYVFFQVLGETGSTENFFDKSNANS
jgi:hypothetical protein